MTRYQEGDKVRIQKGIYRAGDTGEVVTVSKVDGFDLVYGIGFETVNPDNPDFWGWYYAAELEAAE